MLKTFIRSVGVAILSLAVLGVAACGESSEEKATKKVCAATSEISAQVKKLESVAISPSLVGKPSQSSRPISCARRAISEQVRVSPDSHRLTRIGRAAKQIRRTSEVLGDPDSAPIDIAKGK